MEPLRLQAVRPTECVPTLRQIVRMQYNGLTDDEVAQLVMLRCAILNGDCNDDTVENRRLVFMQLEYKRGALSDGEAA